MGQIFISSLAKTITTRDDNLLTPAHSATSWSVCGCKILMCAAAADGHGAISRIGLHHLKHGLISTPSLSCPFVNATKKTSTSTYYSNSLRATHRSAPAWSVLNGITQLPATHTLYNCHGRARPGNNLHPKSSTAVTHCSLVASHYTNPNKDGSLQNLKMSMPMFPAISAAFFNMSYRTIPKAQKSIMQSAKIIKFVRPTKLVTLVIQNDETILREPKRGHT